MAIKKEIIPFTYDENYQKIVEKFIEKGYDAPYEGSNTAVLSSVLAYLVSGLNFNTAVNINENILTLATKRENVVQDARILSYEPHYAKSVILKVNLQFFKPGRFRISKYSQFSVNGFKYVYFGDDLEIDIEDVSAPYPIEIKEGILIRYEDYPELLIYKINEKYEYIDIPWNDVEDNGLEVFVQFYDTYGNLSDNRQFFKSSINILDVNDNYNNVFFRKDDLKSGNARIYFQIGTAGYKLPPNSRIYVNVLRTSGKRAYFEQINSATVEGDLAKYCKIVTIGNHAPRLVQQAQDEENIQSIKDNAPIFNNTASRVVTSHDYASIANRSADIKDSRIWGGEDEYPVKPGNIFYSFTPNINEKNFQVCNRTAVLDISGNNEGYNYRKIAEIDKDMEIIQGTGIENAQYICNFDYKDKLSLFIPEASLTSSLDSAKRGKLGVLDVINKYSLPALVDNIKHPVYFNVDLKVLIKQYPFGSLKSDTRKKIYKEIRKQFEKIEKFNGEYIHSNLVRYLDGILGIGNGIEIKPYFSFMIAPENSVKQIRNKIDFNKLNCFYSKKYDEVGKYLILTIYFSLLSNEGDELSITFNKTNLSIFQLDMDYYTYTLESQDVQTSSRTFYFKDLSFDVNNLQIIYQSFDGLIRKNGYDINLFNLKNKTFYYSVKSNVSITSIKIALPRFARKGDNFKVLGLYGKENAEQIIHFVELSYEDVNNGYILLTDTHNSEHAGISKANNYKIMFISNSIKQEIIEEVNDEETESDEIQVEEDEKPNNEILGTLCNSFDDAKSLTEIQDNITSGIETENLYFNYYVEGKFIHIKIWLPLNSEKNDTIVINYGGKTNILSLNSQMIQEHFVETVIEEQQLDISDILYKSTDPDANIQVVPALIQSLDELANVNNDKISFDNKNLENIIEFVPTNTLEGEISLKTNNSITFYVNYTNKFDVRNLIINYNADDVIVTVNLPENSPLRYEEPYIILSNYRSPRNFNFNLNVEVRRGEFLYQNYTIFCKNPDVSVENEDGPGGVYVYLDIPKEGIYDAKGQLIINNLPFISYKQYHDVEADDDINYESLYPSNSTRKDYSNANIIPLAEDNTTVFVETAKIELKSPLLNDDDIKFALPFWTTMSEYINLDLRLVPYIKFPIIKTTNKGTVKCGTYTIFNSTIPYIRLKFVNDVFEGSTDFLEFALRYPSDNITLQRNSVFKLRSITFDDEIDYESERDDVRKTILHVE